MTLRSLSAALVLTLALLVGSIPPTWPHDLSIATLEGADFDPLDSVLAQGFAQVLGAPVQRHRWPGSLPALQAAADAWDVAFVSAADLQPACDQGLLEKFDWSKLGGKDHYLAPAVSDCGVGAVARATVLTWDRDKVQLTPTWADFWDVVKNPGKRGLRRDVRGTLEIALLADGVAVADVYRLLRTTDGVDRAFRKLDQLKPYIDWWQTEADPARLLASGEVLMTSAESLRIAAANLAQHRNMGMQWAGSLISIDSWTILKGSANTQAAYRFIAYAEDPAQQARLAGIAYGWLEKGAADGQPADVQAASPTAGDHLAAALTVDAAFWRDSYDRLEERFTAWLAAH